MATERQKQANRQNARKSTGPKTAEGKEIASLNAAKHYVLSNRATLPMESPDLFEQLHQLMMTDLQPETPMEHILVDRVVTCTWRLKRVLWAECQADMLQSIDGMRHQATLTRYESALERSLFKALHELQRLQAVRAGVAVPVPVVLEANFQMPSV